MKILLLDNFDSFTYNLYQYIGEILTDKNVLFTIDVIRNNETTVENIKKEKYDKIIISPGPGDPGDKSYFGVCGEVITDIGKHTPILGVCLGMQGIAHYYGGLVVRAQVPMHGKTSLIIHDGKGIFTGIPQNIEVMRYHSLIVDKTTLPKDLRITATAVPTGEIMGLRHITYPVEGIQFHPESFATLSGKLLLTNFLQQAK